METDRSDRRDMTPAEEAAEVEHLLGTATLGELSARLGRTPAGLVKAMERAGRPDLALLIQPLPLDPVQQVRRREALEEARRQVAQTPAEIVSEQVRRRGYRGEHLVALVEPLVAQGMKREAIADQLGMSGSHKGALVNALRRAGRYDLVRAMAWTPEDAAMRRAAARRSDTRQTGVAA